MNDLERYFDANTGRLIHKWRHYFEIYDRHFARFRGQPVNVVEFGVSQGGSLQMWKHYFGAQAQIHGVDINPRCKAVEEPQIRVHTGDQADRAFLRRLVQDIGRIDIVVDDGGHTMEQQIATYEELFPHVDAHGVYLCEDVQTSYWRDWGGGYRRPGTFVEYAKQLVDGLHGWHSEEPERFGVTDFTRSVHSLTWYGNVLVIEKRPMEEPRHETTGTASVRGWSPPAAPAAGGWLARLKAIFRG